MKKKRKKMPNPVLEKEHGTTRTRGGERSVTYQRELVLCGKARCGKLHGPYWYAYWKAPGGRLRKRYIGVKFRELTAAEVRRTEG